MFEHPLCSKDFYYPSSGKEFHSKHYERCIQRYGIDEPVVDKTFHLVSKGIGDGYLTDEKVAYHNKGIEDVFNDNLFNMKKISIINKNCTYVDKNGFKKALPKYYREKIFGHALQHQISDFIQQEQTKVFSTTLDTMRAQFPD